MKLFVPLLLVIILGNFFAFAEREPDYAVKNIPPGLLANANAVMRTYHMEIEIVSMQEVNIKEHYVITVLNDKGDKYASHSEYASQLVRINSIGGCIYDKDGEKVKKIKQSDFIELPASRNAGEFSDAMFKVYNGSYRQYPYTVEYTIETSQNHTFYLPEWTPQRDVHYSVQEGDLVVTTGSNIVLKFKQFHMDAAPAILKDETKKYSWHLKEIPAEKTEPLSFAGTFNTPTILLAVNDFMLDDFKGSTDSWKDFGAFVYQLNEGRDELPAAVRAKVIQMIAGVNDDREKVKILYAYLQHTMRYVSITYGIGGWQTLDAGFLSKNQYGDCKALSNYMMALLSVAGIRSFPVLISAGKVNPRVLEKDFVCSQFNHCILCVPFAKDTTWLECTSSALPVNYLSDFTQDRDALIITPGGGYLVHTPVYDTSVNLIVRHAMVNCSDNDGIKIEMASKYTGEPANQLYRVLKEENEHDKEVYIHAKFHLSSYTVDDYKYRKDDSAATSCVIENATLTASGMYTKTGGRIFLSLDVAPVNMADHEDFGKRKSPFHISESSAVTDSFEFAIPDKTEVEFMPQPVSLRYAFGSYTNTVSQKDNKLVVACRYTLNSGTYDAAQYEHYIKLVDLINSRTDKKVVLKGK